MFKSRESTVRGKYWNWDSGSCWGRVGSRSLVLLFLSGGDGKLRNAGEIAKTTSVDHSGFYPTWRGSACGPSFIFQWGLLWKTSVPFKWMTTDAGPARTNCLMALTSVCQVICMSVSIIYYLNKVCLFPRRKARGIDWNPSFKSLLQQMGRKEEFWHIYPSRRMELWAVALCRQWKHEC